jgi:hypothetical protein
MMTWDFEAHFEQNGTKRVRQFVVEGHSRAAAQDYLQWLLGDHTIEIYETFIPEGAMLVELCSRVREAVV